MSGHPLDWGTAAFRESLDQGPVEVVFDLWKSPDGEPFRFWVYPIKTGELDAISRAGERGGIASHLETIIQRARDKDGKPIFQAGHRARLKNETNGDHILLLTSAINRAVPAPDFDLSAAVKR